VAGPRALAGSPSHRRNTRSGPPSKPATNISANSCWDRTALRLRNSRLGWVHRAGAGAAYGLVPKMPVPKQ
jgi:hypothetical protein